MSSNFDNDPWENGWANEQDKPSPYSSQILSNSISHNPPDQPLTGNTLTIQSADVPETYTKLFSLLGLKVPTTSDLETVLFGPLIQKNILSNFQRTKIMDVCYDHNLLPASIETNFRQIAGLIALEIDVKGTGDYVTLLFRMGNLPDLPEEVIGYFELEDPLSTEWEQKNETLETPVIGATPKVLTSGPGASEPIDRTAINKHINGIRDRFKPLVNSNDAIKIKEVPEKEGLLFKHINYYLTHDLKLGMNSHGGTKKVIRRYSDFVWYVHY